MKSALRAMAVPTLMGALLSAAQGAAPSLPIPPGARSEPLAEQMQINGRIVHIQRFVTADPLPRTVSYYRRLLGPQHVETRMSSRILLAQLQGARLLTVELGGDEEGTAGWVSLVDLGRSEQSMDLLDGLPRDSLVLTDVQTRDGARLSRVRVLHNRHSVDENGRHFEAALRRAGWSVNAQVPSPTSRRYLLDGPGREGMLSIERRDEVTRVTITTLVSS